jgi:predicted dehydrogenase
MTTILRDTKEAPSGEDAIKAIRICDAALRSGKSKTLVNLNSN